MPTKNKQQKNNPQGSSQTAWQEPMIDSAQATPKGILQKLLPYCILFFGSLLLYANTFHHQYALDDEIVISKNEYVLRGIDGFTDIFSKDLFDSFYKQMNTSAQLAGGRYRPLAVASFAIEQEFIGTRENANFEPNSWDFNKNGIKDADEDVNHDGNYNEKDIKSKGFGMRHINNAIFYGLAACMLFLFLSTVLFRKKPWIALAASLLFLAHPMHTEVVANVKSRDEIFSFFFIIATLFLAHQYARHRNLKYLITTCLAFFCAMLSKEYGVALFALVPLSLFLFEEDGFSQKYFQLIGGMLVFFMIYYAIRSSIVQGNESNLQDSELMNNPYLLADDGQKLATKLYIFLKYFLLLILPHPLCSDYGYNSIPYKNFGDWQVWLGILFLFGSLSAAAIAIRKKHWSAFPIAFYLLTILLVTNLIFNIGATMGERLAFHASLGYCILLGFGLNWISERIQQPKAIFVLLLPILCLYSFKTWSRNKAWENDITLALTDVEINPESIALNGNASSRNLDLSELPSNKSHNKEFINKAIAYGRKAVTLHPGFVNGYLNLGLGYAKLEMYDSAKKVWDIAFRIYPHHPSKPVYYNLLASAYYQKGYKCGGEKNWKAGESYIQKAVELDPNNARYWYDLGGFAFNAVDYTTAKNAWTKAYQLNPSDSSIRSVQGMLK